MPSLLLRGGRVIDPLSATDTVADVAITDGVIESIGAHSEPAVGQGSAIIDCRGLVVTPGLIDPHVHVMAGLGDFCVEPDTVGVDMGVPVVVDGGTSGAATFSVCRRAIIDHPATTTRVLAFLDPNQLYLATRDFLCHRLEIANDPRNLDPSFLQATVEANADVIVGLKARACHAGDPDHSPFLAAAQQAAGHRPVMVHLGRFPHTPVVAPKVLLNALRPGDIVTHAFRGGGGMLGPDGKAIPEFADAVDRGVILDMGHSGTDFRFREARRLFEQGYLPHMASTDLNVFNLNGPVFSLAENLTKLLALGIGLADVVAMATSNVARAIGRGGQLGSLGRLRSAEVSVLRLRTDGPFPVSDGHETIAAACALEPVGCVRAGRWIPVLPPRSFARAGRTWADPPDDVDW